MNALQIIQATVEPAGLSLRAVLRRLPETQVGYQSSYSERGIQTGSPAPGARSVRRIFSVYQQAEPPLFVLTLDDSPVLMNHVKSDFYRDASRLLSTLAEAIRSDAGFEAFKAALPSVHRISALRFVDLVKRSPAACRALGVNHVTATVEPGHASLGALGFKAHYSQGGDGYEWGRFDPIAAAIEVKFVNTSPRIPDNQKTFHYSLFGTDFCAPRMDPRGYLGFLQDMKTKLIGLARASADRHAFRDAVKRLVPSYASVSGRAVDAFWEHYRQVTATVEPNSDLVPGLRRVFPGLTLVKSTSSAKLFSTSVSLTVVLYLRPDSASRVVLAYAGHQPPTHGTILCSASDTELPEFLSDMAAVLQRISGFRRHGEPDCLSECQALVAKYEGWHERSTRVLRALMAQQS